MDDQKTTTETGLDHDQKWPDHLVIVRHGQSERKVAKDRARAEHKLEAWSDNLRDVDTPLTPLGMDQAVATGRFLRDRFNFDVVFTSPYLRTTLTAPRIASQIAATSSIMHEYR